MAEIKIAWLFPDTLFLHGERGNILALERFTELAGLKAKTVKVDFETEEFDPGDFDMIFCGPGEISSFPVILEWMKPLQEKFIQYVEDGKPLMVTGTSIALWCKQIQRTDGSRIEGMGLLNVTAEEKEKVYGDDNDFTCAYHGREMEVIGNQIQMADFINHGETAFGQLIYGYGNTGKDREEGFIKNNSIFTNTLAPILVANPWLTMEIIKTAAEKAGIEMQDIQFDAELEEKSFATKKDFILTKQTKLTNCQSN